MTPMKSAEPALRAPVKQKMVKQGKHFMGQA